MVDLDAGLPGLDFESGTVTAVILGIMQDGGLPHIGCRCPALSGRFCCARETRIRRLPGAGGYPRFDRLNGRLSL
ncbi:MAG: hypothetical protein M5U34_48210 [Chloroflexi bacterium]|nr:hypothetical protein [Chloroflexota bacterium]